MSQFRFVLSLIVTATLTSVALADIQFSNKEYVEPPKGMINLADNSDTQNKPISGTSAGGQSLTTIVDVNGNLKVVPAGSHPSSATDQTTGSTQQGEMPKPAMPPAQTGVQVIQRPAPSPSAVPNQLPAASSAQPPANQPIAQPNQAIPAAPNPSMGPQPSNQAMPNQPMPQPGQSIPTSAPGVGTTTVSPAQPQAPTQP